MKLPRDVSGEEFVRLLARLGYVKVRQSGSHVRLVCEQTPEGRHFLTIPMHPSLKTGLLSGILTDVQRVHRLGREEVVTRLFG